MHQQREYLFCSSSSTKQLGCLLQLLDYPVLPHLRFLQWRHLQQQTGCTSAKLSEPQTSPCAVKYNGERQVGEASCLQTHHLTAGTDCNRWTDGFHTPWQGLMVQTPSSVGANHDLQKSIMSGGLVKAKASVSHTKKFFSQVCKSVVLRLWKTYNYGNSKARLKMYKSLAEANSLGIYHYLVNAQLLLMDQDLKGIMQQ